MSQPIDLQDFIGGFVAEAEELIGTATAALLDIESGAAEGASRPRSLRELFRALHTIKGQMRALDAMAKTAQEIATSTQRTVAGVAEQVRGSAEIEGDGRRAQARGAQRTRDHRAGSPIKVELSATDARATIIVSNAVRGEPIPPERLASLFEPYRRGGVSEHNARGLGLGLFIAQEIVRAHRGTISAESTAGGTAFHVDLPREPRAS